MSDLAAQVRERLGLPSDADDAAVTAALDQRLGTGEQQATPTPDAGPAGPNSVPATTDPAPAGQSQQGEQQVSASALEQIVTARVAAAVAPFRTQLEQTSRELADRKERERLSARDTLLASAVAAGKITPADKPKWSELYDKSADSAAAVEQVFASLAKGTAVPTAPTSGTHTGGAEPTTDGFTDAEYASLFPGEKAGAA